MNRRSKPASVFVLAVCACLPAGPSPTVPPPAVTLLPSPIPRAADPTGSYRLRLELTTTSDWTTLELLNPESLLTVRQTGTSGGLSGTEAGMTHLVDTQPLESSQGCERVGLTVELALDPSATA
jgi:hypothetical protein